MVRDIQHERGTGQVAAKTRRKAEPQPQPEPPEVPAADAQPEDLVLKEPKRDRPKRARNKRHGRPR
jgi:SecD/SecF fusion protein